MSNVSFRAGLTMVGLLVLGCTGSVDGDGKAGGDPGSGDPGSPGNPGNNGKPGGNLPPPPPVNASDTANLAGPRPLRRLTLLEYSNTIRDLLGEPTAAGRGGGFSVDIPSPAGFVSGAKITSAVDAKHFVDASERLAAGAVARFAELLPKGCHPAPGGAADDGCAKQFIKQFGLRAYRRPLSAAEEGEHFEFYRKLRGADIGASFPDAIKEVISAFIQSPSFLYRWELGGEPIKDGPLYRLDNWEMASRLSYYLWASMPDAALFAAAGNGELQNLDRIADEARRMLKDPRAKDAIRDFHLQWLGVEGLPDLQKDPSFTSYTPETARAMLDETSELAISLIWDPQGSGKLGDLFSSASSFVDARLAKVYGVGNVTGDNLRKASLDPSQRAGVLTHGSFLASHADADLSHPVKRGVEVLRTVLCQDLPNPDGLEIPELPAPQPGQTTRERYAAHSQGSCAGCHKQIDGVGFAFENYDAIGGFRTTEQMKPIDSSGVVPLPSGELRFTKGIDFIKQLAGTKELRDCVAKQWLRYVLRRTEVPEEAGSLKALGEAFSASEWDLRELLVAVTRTRAFTHRKPGDGEGQ